MHYWCHENCYARWGDGGDTSFGQLSSPGKSLKLTFQCNTPPIVALLRCTIVSVWQLYSTPDEWIIALNSKKLQYFAVCSIIQGSTSTFTTGVHVRMSGLPAGSWALPVSVGWLSEGQCCRLHGGQHLWEWFGGCGGTTGVLHLQQHTGGWLVSACGQQKGVLLPGSNIPLHYSGPSIHLVWCM